LDCPANSKYSPKATQCPNTCSDPDASTQCSLEDAEGCECTDGYIMSGTKCVPKNQCGCVDKEDVYHTVSFGTIVFE